MNTLTLSRIAAIGLAFTLMSACGIGKDAIKDRNGGSDGIGTLPADQGSVEFDLSGLNSADVTRQQGLPDMPSANDAAPQKGSVEPSPVSSPIQSPILPPAPSAKLVIYYAQHCQKKDMQWDEVYEVETKAPAPTPMPDSSAANSNTTSSSSSEPFVAEKCFTGKLSIDLSQTKVANIEKIPAGTYTFTAYLYAQNGALLKRGSAQINVIGGQVTKGKIVLYTVSGGNGGVIIDIVDGDKPVSSVNSCVEYKTLSTSIRSLECAVGEFKCSYGTKTAVSSCSDFDARLSLLKQLCSEKAQYEPLKLKCEHAR